MAELIKPGYNDTADIADINSNTDEFAARIAACKPKQTAKTDPSADGTSATFIATLTQNANGEVTATKKTVRTMTGATSSVAGATGLIPAPGTGDVGKFLKGDGSWGTPTNTTYSEATSSAYGLVKVGYTTSGKNYAVQLSSGKMYVNVPWTDNNTTYSQASSSALGLIKIGYTASGKNYPVQLDSSGKAYVNVPWTDNNTTYNAATSSAYGLIKIGYSANNKNYPVQLDSNGKAYVNVPWTTPGNATTGAAGLMSAADKTKLDGIATGAQVNPGVATSSANGLMSKTDKSKLDGIESGAQKNPGAATSSAYGLIKIGYTASGKNYPVQLSNGQAYVNVPWTDTNTWRGMQLKAYEMTSNYTLQPGASTSVSATWMDYKAITDYTPVAIRYFNTGSSSVIAQAVTCTNFSSNPVMILKNIGSSTVQAKANMGVLWLHN